MSSFGLLGAEILQEGIPFRFCARGRSMRPTIYDGDELLVEAVDPREVTAGNVVMVFTEGGIRVHRLVSCDRSGDGEYLLRGDALDSCDAPVREEELLGRVVSAFRKGRRLRVDGPVVMGKIALFRFLRGIVRFFRRAIRAAGG